MKFRDGYWEIREGVQAFHPVEILDAAAGSGKAEDPGPALTLYSACKKSRHRGDRVGGALLTLRIGSPMEDVMHLRMYHHQGGLRRGPEFGVPPDTEGLALPPPAGGGEYRFEAGAFSAAIAAEGDWRLIFSRRGERVTELSGRNSGYFTDHGRPFMAQYLGLSVGETIYGLGERFTPFVKNGQRVDIWNEDGGTASEQAYKNIPFYLSSRGYGVLVNNPGRVSFEVGSEVVSAVQFSVPGEVIDYYIIAGGSLKEVIRNYTALTGRPALPPAWSFGLWLSTSFTTDYDEKTVNTFIDGMAERKIPLSVFHFDCFWRKECQWVDFEWDREQFPDPEGMLKRLHDRGLRVCLWINPYVAQKSPLFDEGMAAGYLVKKASGEVWQWDRWQPGMALVDFTNPAALRWYQNKLRRLLDMGVDCFKTDFGERIPTDVEWYNGADPQGMHNYYTFLYNQAVFTLLEETRGRGEAVVFARSATAGSQRFPVHWGGDCAATYESMAETLRGGLSLGLCGFGFWSHDISGFEQTAAPDLFKRWTAFGLLSSHSRLHGNQSYRVPWNFDEEACEVLRFFTELKGSLMPYLYGAALQACREGIPLLRAMILEFPGDPACAFLDRQYMLGDSLLVAPVFDDGGEVSYYLPNGRWTRFVGDPAPEVPEEIGENGKGSVEGPVIEGGRWRRERHGYLSLPLLARPNSVIPLGAGGDDHTDGVCFHVFELEEGRTIRFTVPGPRGETGLEAVITRNRKEFSAAAAGARNPWGLCLRGIHAFRSLSHGVSVQDSGAGLLVSAAAGTETLRIGL
jgi:alpha-D-xyloside xylohydrolase